MIEYAVSNGELKTDVTFFQTDYKQIDFMSNHYIENFLKSKGYEVSKEQGNTHTIVYHISWED